MIGEYIDPGLFMSSFMIMPFVRDGARNTMSDVTKRFSYQSFKPLASHADLMLALEEISSYKQLSEDWDGYGAAPLDPKTISNGLSAAYLLIGKAPLPDLTPNPNGTISMEWESADGLAHLEIGKSRYAFFIRMNSGWKFIHDGSADQVPVYFADSLASVMYSTPTSAPTMSGTRLIGAAA